MTFVKATDAKTKETPLYSELIIEQCEKLDLKAALETRYKPCASPCYFILIFCRALRPFNKYAVDTYLKTFGPFYRLRIKLLTGVRTIYSTTSHSFVLTGKRTHQIRAQLYAKNMVIVGDHTYGFPGYVIYHSLLVLT